ncbi:hypothetical protein IGK98_002714 [Enterococcus sp. AZ134]
MKVIHKQFIGQDTEISMVYSKGGYSGRMTKKMNC